MTIKFPFFSFLLEIEYYTRNRKGKVTSEWGAAQDQSSNKGKYSGPQEK